MRGGPAGRPVIEWSAAQRAKPGEVESGDQYVVCLSPELALVGIVDGLGHGAEAAAAARRAVGTLQDNPGGGWETDGGGAPAIRLPPSSFRADETIVSLVRRCHEALRPTRGAVMGLAVFRAWENGMQWLDVGNIEGVIVRAQATARPRVERLLAYGGIVGHRLPRLHVSTVPLTRDDVVVLATDGIRSDFAESLTADEPWQVLADRILARYGKDSDDALVLVARYVGPAP